MCRKTKTKVITPANHKRHEQSREPIKTRGKYMCTCEHLTFIHFLFNLSHTLNNVTTPTISSNNEYAINVVQNNTTIVDLRGHLKSAII